MLWQRHDFDVFTIFELEQHKIMQNLLGEIIVSYSRIGFPKTNYIVRNSQKSF